MSQLFPFFISLVFLSCKEDNANLPSCKKKLVDQPILFESVKAIPPSKGFERVACSPGSFGEWLRNIRLKKDGLVYLFDGSLKKNQTAQFAVLDIPVGKRDLQQCADAVMRLRADYLFDQKRYTEIIFRDNNNTPYAWKGAGNKQNFNNYLESVFGMCGTASLEKQLKPVSDCREIQPGDVFIRGGFPGHAMIVVDVAINKEGKEIFLLAQSYMPAQDIHIVQNPLDAALSPWYELSAPGQVVTPEWVFRYSQLRKW